MLFPVREWSPCKCSPVLSVGVLQLFVEPKDFHVVCVNDVNKVFELLEAEVLFFDESDDCVLFVAVGSKHAWWKGGGGIKLDM